MRKALTFICVLIMTLIFPLAVMIGKGLPADTRALVAEKYAGWNGVLQGWVCCEWGGGFISWLNGCAADFEKRHEGVYIEFIPVSVQNVQAMLRGGITSPDMLLFSPGIVSDEAALRSISPPDELRKELRFSEHAWPVAMGGYILAVNPSLPEVEPAAIADDEHHSWSAALAALTSDPPSDAEIEIMDPGLDLGLPASAGETMDIQAALDAFINGELACLPVSQDELARLMRLRDAGRGADWTCTPTGRIAYTDQLLLAGFPVRSNHAERNALAEEFARSLLEPEHQAALAKSGAFAVTGERIHAAHSAHAQMDALLNSRPLVLPECFSEYWQRGAAAIVREALNEDAAGLPRDS